MVEKRLKIVNKSWMKEELLSAIKKIISKDFNWLDIKQLSGKKWYYRCRIGKLRIIFFEKNGDFYVDKVGYRWDIYKDF